MHFKVSVNSSAYKNGIAVRGYFTAAQSHASKKTVNQKAKVIVSACSISISTSVQQQESTTSQAGAPPQSRPHSH
jgi:hypothetical protein